MKYKIASVICLLMLSSATLAEALYFDTTPVSVVAAKMNQVNPRKIQFADSAAAHKPVSGRFRMDHPGSLVRALEQLYPDLEVIETRDGWVVKTRKNP